MMVLGPGHLVRALFRFPLKILLVVLVTQNPLVMSVDNFNSVESLKYFGLVESMECFDLVDSFEYFDLI